MTNRLKTKVRLVKCPKCSKILPEPEEVPLYTCGGCSTVLQAKYYRSDNKAAALASREQNDLQFSGINPARDGGESSESSRRSSSSSEQASTQIEQRNGNADSERNGAKSPVHHTSLTEESNFLENKEYDVDKEIDQLTTSNQVVQNQGQLEAPNSAGGATIYRDNIVIKNEISEEISTENAAIEGDNGQEEQYNGTAIESQDLKQIREVNNTSETSAPKESKVLQKKESQRLDGVEDEGDQHEPLDNIFYGKLKEIGHGNAAREAFTSNESQPVEKPLQLAPENGAKSDDSHNLLVGDQSREDIEGNETDCLDADKPEVVAKLGREDDNGKDQNNFVESTREQFESVMLLIETPLTNEISWSGSDNLSAGNEASLEACRTNNVSSPSSATDQKIASESNASAGVQDLQVETSSLDNFRETSWQMIENSDKHENPERVITQGDVGTLLKAVPRSSRGSPAYDGSVSSVDGNDEQVAGQPEHVGVVSSPGSDAVADYVCAEESPDWNNIPSNRMTYRNSRIHSQARSYLSMPLDEKLKHSVVEEEESVEENGIRGRYTTRPYRDGFPPRIPYHRRSSEVAFETGSSSSYVHDEPLGHWPRQHPHRYEDSELWVRKTYMHERNVDRRRFSGATCRETEFLPMSYNDETLGEVYHRPKYQGYTDRRRRADSWSQSGTLPRIQYSGEVFNERYQMRDPYMHRHPDDRRWSAQLPPTAGYHRQGQRMAPFREASWDPYDAYSTSPQRFTDLESYAWAHDSISLSDDHRHKDHIMKKLYTREKQQAVKRHLLPMAGAAPFITCYFCFNVLQMPEYFLLSKRRRHHRLKCGSCLSILEFSLQNETRLAPYMQGSGEGAENYVDRKVSTASSSHVSNSRGSKLANGEAHASGRELLQHNSFGALGREKSKLMARNSRNNERLNESHDEANPSAQSKQVKVTWQLPARSKSPLHRLMGYPSPEDLLIGHEPDEVED